MTDRELLRLAAIVCGELRGEWVGNDAYFDGVLTRWNPLTDDGDALRLAVKLEIAINPFAGKTVVAHTESNRMAHEKWDCCDDDPYAATRRAIVRAAAEIGRQHD